MSKKHIPFGIMLHGPGSHMNAWKHPSVPADASVNLPFYIDIVQRAETNGIAFGFVADSLYHNEAFIPHFLNRFEPISILSALAAVTKKIGLVGTVSTSNSDPFPVSRQFASLDLISGGRAGWNVLTTPLDGSGRNVTGPNAASALDYEIADEYLSVTQQLWDSWDDDAFPRDRGTGLYFDRNKLHSLNHRGRHFQVEGPLNIGRSPQGQPVIFQAGSSDAGIALAGKFADVVFTSSPSLADARAAAQQIRKDAIAHGRPEHVKIFPHISPVVAATDAEADIKYRRLRTLPSTEEALAHLGRFFDHHDFSQYRLDAPFPDLGDLGDDGVHSMTARIKADARNNHLTLREVARNIATPTSHFVGSGRRVANELIRWVDQGAADGFILGFPVQAEGLDDFVKYVVPVLHSSGRYQRTLAGHTLRDHLGLPRKASRYAESERPQRAQRTSPGGHVSLVGSAHSP